MEHTSFSLMAMIYYRLIFLRTAHTIASKATDSILVHPEAHLQFGVEEDCTLVAVRRLFLKKKRMHSSCHTGTAGQMFSLVSVKIFLEYPFVPASDGYGYEDFHSIPKLEPIILNMLLHQKQSCFIEKAVSVSSAYFAKSFSPINNIAQPQLLQGHGRFTLSKRKAKIKSEGSRHVSVSHSLHDRAEGLSYTKCRPYCPQSDVQ